MELINPIPQSIEYKVFGDDRGIFAPVFDEHQTYAPQAGLLKRVYYVYNHARGTIRGFHYHETEWKFFAIVRGAGKFVALDPKHPDVTYQFVSSARKNNVIIIPPRFANGWVSLEDETILLCASNLSTKESVADDKRFDPYQWGDVWSVKAR